MLAVVGVKPGVNTPISKKKLASRGCPLLWKSKSLKLLVHVMVLAVARPDNEASQAIAHEASNRMIVGADMFAEGLLIRGWAGRVRVAGFCYFSKINHNCNNYGIDLRFATRGEFDLGAARGWPDQARKLGMTTTAAPFEPACAKSARGRP
ncbi:MAG: hypothetical protein K1X78_26650 [Verrucomicrobiaceae bacterium]|nr:hypothetical protein [Verrucomicrobiaceae bacterium]